MSDRLATNNIIFSVSVGYLADIDLILIYVTLLCWTKISDYFLYVDVVNIADVGASTPATTRATMVVA